MQTPIDVSVWQRIQLGHAALQVIADRARVDLLHLKGPALDSVLAPVPRHSTDADVWVRPSQVETLIGELPGHGYRLVADFDEGSPFEHAATYYHPQWGYVDVHRRFPGLPGEEAVFDRLWRDHTTISIAGHDCTVPSVIAQRLVLMLHSARRDSPHALPDLRLAWHEADEDTRDQIRRLVEEVGGQIGFAAATGHVDDYRGTPEWRMWTTFTGQGSRLGEWRARFLLARGWRAKAHVLARLVRVNRAHLAMQLGHEPTRAQLVRAFVQRIGHGARELTAAAALRIGRRR